MSKCSVQFQDRKWGKSDSSWLLILCHSVLPIMKNCKKCKLRNVYILYVPSYSTLVCYFIILKWYLDPSTMAKIWCVIAEQRLPYQKALLNQLCLCCFWDRDLTLRHIPLNSFEHMSISYSQIRKWLKTGDKDDFSLSQWSDQIIWSRKLGNDDNSIGLKQGLWSNLGVDEKESFKEMTE